MPRLAERRAQGLVVNVMAGVEGWTLPTTTALMAGVRVESLGLDPDAMTLPAGTVYGLPHIFAEAGWATLLDTANVVVAVNLHEGFGEMFTPDYSVPFSTQADEVLAWLDQAPPTTPRFVWLQSMSLHVPYDRLDESCEAAAIAADDACPADVIHPVTREGYPPGEFEDLAEGDQAACATAIELAQRCAATRVDAELDSFLDALPPDAWVVVTADHGEGWLDPHVEHNWGASVKLTRSHLLLLHPSLAGESVALASQVDLAPTLLELTGLSRPDLSFEGVVLGQPQPSPPTAWHCDGFGNSEVAAFSDTFQLIRAQRRKTGTAYTLFDLAADPAGEVDVSGSITPPAELVSAADAVYSASSSLCPVP